MAISSQGESSTSEGYVYEAINGASNEKLPVIFVIQDNNYGISVHKRDQTANWRAADNFSGFKNLRIIHCDGKNVFDSMNAMTEARRHALEKSEPVIVHASTSYTAMTTSVIVPPKVTLSIVTGKRSLLLAE